MQAILYWVIGYLGPMIFTYLSFLFIFHKTKHGKKDWVQFTTIHSGIIISILLNQYFLYQNKIAYSFHTTGFALGLLFLIYLGSFRFIGKFSLVYMFSSFLQQICITSAVLLLLSFYPLTTVLILIVPPYVLGHIHNNNQWRIKTIPTTLWGITCVLLYSATLDVFLNTALHLLIGTYGIKRRVLYTEMEA